MSDCILPVVNVGKQVVRSVAAGSATGQQVSTQDGNAVELVMKNGMRSVIGLLGRQDFPRLRVGVGKKPEGWELADWVLSRFTPDELRQLANAIERCTDAVELILGGNIAEAMNRYNGA